MQVDLKQQYQVVVVKVEQDVVLEEMELLTLVVVEVELGMNLDPQQVVMVVQEL
tara:strand:+ start:1000 stop:1161 length:162 start_codon:yes stop_codon:yes gene_type:complete